MKMLKRFMIYYRPHLPLFLLDMGVAVLASIASIVFPTLTRILLKDYLPAQNTRMIAVILSICAGLMVVKAASTYIRIKWGHIGRAHGIRHAHRTVQPCPKSFRFPILITSRLDILWRVFRQI